MKSAAEPAFVATSTVRAPGEEAEEARQRGWMNFAEVASGARPLLRRHGGRWLLPTWTLRCDKLGTRRFPVHRPEFDIHTSDSCDEESDLLLGSRSLDSEGC